MVKTEVKTVNLNDIKINPDNPRRISEKDMDRLIKSLHDFPDMMGIREIVVDETMTVLGGNMRLLALRKSGANEATVKIVSGLTTEQKREFVVKDNATFGEWDFDLLANEWGDLPLDDWGLDLPEEWLKVPETEVDSDAEPQIDRAEELNKTWNVKPGDLWLIGEHRLLCGDSTKPEDVARVMGGVRADLCLTDPPYGLGDTVSAKNEYDNHADTVENLHHIIETAIPAAREVSSVLLLTPGTTHHRLYPAPTWTMAWFVPAGTGVGPWGFCCWQPILCYGKDPKLAAGKGSHPDAIVHTESAEKLGHPCSKPILFWRWLMERASEVGGLCYDPFLGSGTTMVAAQNLNRKCYGVEISPGYCAVILQRMADAFPSLEIRRAE